MRLDGGWLSRCWDLHNGRRLTVAEVEMVLGSTVPALCL